MVLFDVHVLSGAFYRLETEDQKLKIELHRAAPRVPVFPYPARPLAQPRLQPGLFTPGATCLLTSETMSRTSGACCRDHKQDCNGLPNPVCKAGLRAMLPRLKSQLCHLEVVTFRDICLKPESLHLHPTHLPKSQLVLEEVDDAFMSRSEGTRRDNEVSMHHRSLLPQRFF